MEADWEFEVGGDAPVIDACWPGFVDLRLSPERARELSEATQLPGLARALQALNGTGSPVWTSKCDLWASSEPQGFDSDELDAPPGCSAHVVACYIDLLPRTDLQWSLPHLAEGACRQLCSLLGAVPLRCCRVDLVVRTAFVNQGRIDLGITAYVTACGATLAEAKGALESALAAFAHALCSCSTVQWESVGE